MMLVGLLLSVGLLMALTDTGESGDDSVVTLEEDITEGSDGDDVIAGDDGVDIILGAEGDDSIRGGGDVDLILGEGGDDFLRGGQGDDAIIGGEGADTLEGASGDDLLDGTGLLDEATMIASLQNPNAYGGVVAVYELRDDTDEGDVIDGGNGNDTINVGTADTVTGGSGEDVFTTGFWIDPDTPAEVEDFDPDEDLISFSYVGVTPPSITIEDDADGNANLLADGETMVVLANAAGTVSVTDVILVREA